MSRPLKSAANPRDQSETTSQPPARKSSRKTAIPVKNRPASPPGKQKIFTGQNAPRPAERATAVATNTHSHQRSRAASPPEPIPPRHQPPDNGVRSLQIATPAANLSSS